MSNKQNITIKNIPQMIDINKNYQNFQSHFHVICANQFKFAILFLNLRI